MYAQQGSTAPALTTLAPAGESYPRNGGPPQEHIMKDGPQGEIDCPLPLATITELKNADPGEVVASVLPLSEELRIKLALYCYNRAHLRPLGLIVAATIDPERLAQLGGTLGEVIAAQSRASGLSFGTEPLPEPKKRAEKPKPKISLGGRGWVDR
jgi:hypothetical protein